MPHSLGLGVADMEPPKGPEVLQAGQIVTFALCPHGKSLSALGKQLNNALEPERGSKIEETAWTLR